MIYVFIVGLTGGIASGKTTLACFLKEKGAIVIDADKIAKELVGEERIRDQIKAAFGPGVFFGNSVDRKKLGEVVFTNPAKLSQLNNIMFDDIEKIINDELNLYSKTLPPNQVLIIDAPLLIEANLISKVDWVVVITSKQDIKIARLYEKGLTYKEAEARIYSQMEDEKRTPHADYIIENNSTIDCLKEQANILWEEILKKARF